MTRTVAQRRTRYSLILNHWVLFAVGFLIVVFFAVLLLCVVPYSELMARTSTKYAGDVSLIALGNAIKAERGERGLSQEDLAYLSHVDRSYMSSIERGEKNTGIIALRRVAQAMEMTLAELMVRAGL